ncbi:hypothetical protein BDW02DRAFT_504134 [Decorospora gaudefroyi]|uniref:Uncharacterized protein n=1 Tax=Decorospora gaudefroyi TaxID=184978 RepID=A0A6A5K789_9PLEO|nr:hypothetical protein BDW02DRAFT_504134 [Decorospora gaudefroyi]
MVASEESSQTDGDATPWTGGALRGTAGDALLRAALLGDSEEDELETDADTVSLLSTEDSNEEQWSDDPAPHAGRELRNKKIHPEETLAPHDIDPTLIIATFKYQLPDGSGWYIQQDTIPEQRPSSDEDKFQLSDRIFLPDLDEAKVPRKYKTKRSNDEPKWINTGAYSWERTSGDNHEVWDATFVFRRFNARTHKYEHCYFAEKKMENIDPNNKAWVYAYNKWLDQINRRSNAEYQQKKSREHWTATEISAMYDGLNAYIRTNGIDAFHRMSNADLQTIVDGINTAGNKNRGLDALRGQINSAHERKNASIAYLRENGPALASYIEEGGEVSQEERFPEYAIPLEEYPE